MNFYLKYFLFVSAGFSLHQVYAQKINPYQYSIQKKIECRNGAVVSAHPLASKVGVNILQQGGNAVDAAIATQLALAVLYPGAGKNFRGGFHGGRVAKRQEQSPSLR